MRAAPVISFPERSDGALRLLAALVEDRVASRLFSGDAALWGPAAEAEASVRLGWIDAPARAEALIDEIGRLRAELVSAGIDRIVLCGMGGSSLAPEVIARHQGVGLTVLDSTHPAAVRRALQADPAGTVVVVSSKSGSTIETRSHLAAFERRFGEAGIDPAGRIVVVTDPGSALEAHAREAGYRVFLADPTVGGRFSALTAFGLVPTGLAGADLRALIGEALSIAPRLVENSVENPALQLAAALFDGLPDRYACLLVESAPRSGLGDWIEQLVAESTGKDGDGVLPVVLPPDAPELTWSDRPHGTLIRLVLDPESHETPFAAQARLTVTAPLGAQLLLWEAATAVLCKLMGVNPFDQPDVEAAKIAARAALEGAATDAEGAPVDERPGVGELAVELGALEAERPAGGYLAIQAYVDEQAVADGLAELRAAFAERWRAPVTLGIGPRFLHSTGQLHKGGPPRGMYLQLVETPRLDEEIPGSGSGFAALMEAQAEGDREVLRERGRPVLVLRGPDARALIADLLAALRG